MPNLKTIYCAGLVQRYHTNPWLARFGQTNAAHQGHAVQLLLLLFPNATHRLIRAVALHDVGERLAADLPAGIGRKYPALKEAHAAADAEARAELLGDDPVAALTSYERRILKFIDQLEPIFFMLTHAPQARYHDGWPEAIKNAKAEAWYLELDLAADLCHAIDSLIESGDLS
jgi:5'-deoxynucleotidase YfbR-like HD superfamily hydrolase